MSQQRGETQKQKLLSDDLQRNKRRLVALNQSLFCEYPHPTKRDDDWKTSDNIKDQLRILIFMPLFRKLVSLVGKAHLQRTQISEPICFHSHQHSAIQRPQQPHKSLAPPGKSGSSPGCIHRELLECMEEQ